MNTTQELNEAQAECQALMQRISEGLAKMDSSWPAVGSAKHTRAILREALAAVGGLTEAEMKEYGI